MKWISKSHWNSVILKFWMQLWFLQPKVPTPWNCCKMKVFPFFNKPKQYLQGSIGPCLYLSGLNKMAPILNNEQWAVIGAKTNIIWEEQLLDPTNNYITSVFVSLPLVLYWPVNKQVTLKPWTNIILAIPKFEQ